ncbi:MAG: hypothetical protein FJ125_05805, partial [Deltaproteobacteria bacterium]|nr:hypothetical protein [Deltaproteobacteria bacterium]
GERLVLMVANVQEDVDWDGFWSDRRFQLAVDYRVAPRLVAVTPDTLAPGDRAVLRLTGSGFAAGVRVEVRGEGVELHDCRRIDGRQIDCSVLVHEDARPGARNLVVANDPEDAGQSSTLHSALQIAPAEPLELRELRPDRAAAGAELLVQLAGRGLGPGLQPRLSCPGVEVAGLHPVSTRLLYLALRLAASAPPGPCSLELADGRARRSTLPDAFFVLPPAADVDGAGSGSQAEGEGCRLAVPAAAPQPVTAPGRLAGSLPGSPLPGSPLPGSPLPGSSLPGSPLPGSPLPGSPPPALLLQGLLLLLPLLALRLRRLHRPPRPGRAQRGPRRR